MALVTAIKASLDKIWMESNNYSYLKDTFRILCQETKNLDWTVVSVVVIAVDKKLFTWSSFVIRSIIFVSWRRQIWTKKYNVASKGVVDQLFVILCQYSGLRQGICVTSPRLCNSISPWPPRFLLKKFLLSSSQSLLLKQSTTKFQR